MIKLVCPLSKWLACWVVTYGG